MVNSEVVGGFQFELSGISITSATAPEGYFISTSSTTVLGFSLTGASIPAGSGLLSTVSFTGYTGDPICFGEDTGSSGDTAISDANGVYIPAEWGDCFVGGEVMVLGCTDMAACNYDDSATEDDSSCEYAEDECGVCGGSGAIYECGCSDIPDGTCDCDGNELDECDVCGGDGSSCIIDCETEACVRFENVDLENGSLDIQVANHIRITGLQFGLSGLDITNAEVINGSLLDMADFAFWFDENGIMAASINGNDISPSGYSSWIKIFFSNSGENICFDENGDLELIVADEFALAVETTWGPCYCTNGSSDNCGVCGGDSFFTDSENNSCIEESSSDCVLSDNSCDCNIIYGSDSNDDGEPDDYSPHYFDECNRCGGDSFSANCIDTDNCSEMDCLGTCFGDAEMLPYCEDFDGDGLGSPPNDIYCSANVPENWVLDCSDQDGLLVTTFPISFYINDFQSSTFQDTILTLYNLSSENQPFNIEINPLSNNGENENNDFRNELYGQLDTISVEDQEIYLDVCYGDDTPNEFALINVNGQYNGGDYHVIYIEIADVY